MPPPPFAGNMHTYARTHTHTRAIARIGAVQQCVHVAYERGGVHTGAISELQTVWASRRVEVPA